MNRQRSSISQSRWSSKRVRVSPERKGRPHLAPAYVPVRKKAKN